jgi:DNA-binding MarR family transcriptional regulator
VDGTESAHPRHEVAIALIVERATVSMPPVSPGRQQLPSADADADAGAAIDGEDPSGRVPDAGLAAFRAAMGDFTLAQRRANGRFGRAPAVPELSTPQFHLLEPLVGAAGPLSVGGLSAAAGVSAPTATRMLDGLFARGLITREASLADRRSILIDLTDEGRALMTAKYARMQELQAELFAGLSADEQRGAAHLLSRLAEGLEGLEP